jgi:hypothetical protein
MRGWKWCLVAVAGLGLAGCEKREEESLMRPEVGRLGEEPAVEQEAPLEGKGVLGGEDMGDQEFFGTVTSVGPRQLVVRNDGGEQLRLQLNESTELVREGVKVRPQEVREGSNVRASYDERDGAYIATEVTVFPSPVQQAPNRGQ